LDVEDNFNRENFIGGNRLKLGKVGLELRRVILTDTHLVIANGLRRYWITASQSRSKADQQ